MEWPCDRLPPARALTTGNVVVGCGVDGDGDGHGDVTLKPFSNDNAPTCPIFPTS